MDGIGSGLSIKGTDVSALVCDTIDRSELMNMLDGSYDWISISKSSYDAGGRNDLNFVFRRPQIWFWSEVILTIQIDRDTGACRAGITKTEGL